MQQTINNGDSGLDVRTKLNDMFTELYGASTLPIKIKNIGTNETQVIPENTLVQDLTLSKVSGTPVIRIGTTANGEEILADTNVGDFTQAAIDRFYSSNSTWYLTISGGVLNIRINVINNYY